LGESSETGRLGSCFEALGRRQLLERWLMIDRMLFGEEPEEDKKKSEEEEAQ
jgi:hypothetical protein